MRLPRIRDWSLCRQFGFSQKLNGTIFFRKANSIFPPLKRSSLRRTCPFPVSARVQRTLQRSNSQSPSHQARSQKKERSASPKHVERRNLPRAKLRRSSIHLLASNVIFFPYCVYKQMRKVLLNSSRRDITALPTLALLPFFDFVSVFLLIFSGTRARQL